MARCRRRKRVFETADRDDASIGYRKPVPLRTHLDGVVSWAERLCDRLQIDQCRGAIVDAGSAHDIGKDRPWWQRAIGVTAPPPLAKSGRKGFDQVVNAGYRHKLGSLTDLLTREQRPADLVAHLVASHHGHARPGFTADAGGPSGRAGADDVVAGAAVRFVRLQRDLGHWQLAYLEAILKAADALSSREGDA